MSLDEFKNLCKITPSTLEEIGEIFERLEAFERSHPELQRQIDFFLRIIEAKEPFLDKPLSTKDLTINDVL